MPLTQLLEQRSGVGLVGLHIIEADGLQPALGGGGIVVHEMGFGSEEGDFGAFGRGRGGFISPAEVSDGALGGLGIVARE